MMKTQILLFTFLISVLINIPLNAQNFIHPGMLHTQEDFDRIKEQLEAGETQVVQGYNKLKSNAYSSSSVTTYPVEHIVRGGGSGENYMNAARGAAMAYQNALRWKIGGEKAHAEKAVDILNSWARICKSVGGDTNQSLAAGLYGYQFANAAELMRDYEGWKEEDFHAFKDWMLYIWYPRSIDFLRRRHDTWRNGSPGHYWSNWGLCNVLCVMSIGILCDDVFIYNQGVSFYKYDIVGNFNDEEKEIIKNSGLTEFLGNLVPAMYEDKRGPAGYFGQMQESGRDQGHSLMAVGLAVDICQIAWNQGDDLFSYMDNRLAAGIEYVAAYNSNSIEAEQLPWTNYAYCDVRCNDGLGWVQTGINGGGRGNDRPYWDRILAHYEGIKGLSMPYSRAMKKRYNVDGGGGDYSQNSGGFDHLGFSSLTCFRPATTPDKSPVKLIPSIIYKGKTYFQNEFGGLKNTFNSTNDPGVEKGSTIKLSPTLPENSNDTGKWEWSTGEKVRELEMTIEKSGIYRVCYTNENGIKSFQSFSIAVNGDCSEDKLTPEITLNGKTYNDTILSVMSNAKVTLALHSAMGYGKWKWNNNLVSSSITIQNINSNRIYSVSYTNQGGVETKINFHIQVTLVEPFISVDGKAAQQTNSVIVGKGQSVELIPIIQTGKEGGIWKWSNGNTSKNLLLDNIQKSGDYTVSYTYDNTEYLMEFSVYVSEKVMLTKTGDYFIKDAKTNKFLTNDKKSNPVFSLYDSENPGSQTWTISVDGNRHKIESKLDRRFLNEYAVFSINPYYYEWNSYTFYNAVGSDLYAIQNAGSSGTDYWTSDGSYITGKGSRTMDSFPFVIVPYSQNNLESIDSKSRNRVYPNPTTDFLTILITEERFQKADYTLFSIDGKQLKSIPCNTGENQIEMSHLKKGIYLGRLNIDGKIEMFKLIKN